MFLQESRILSTSTQPSTSSQPTQAICPPGLAFTSIFGNSGTRLSYSRERVDLGFDFKCWLGGETTVSAVVVDTTNGQIVMIDDANTSLPNPDANLMGLNGHYGWPRIAVVQALLKSASGRFGGIDIATLISSRPDSLMISWENLQFMGPPSGTDVNVQAELFANGAVNICYGDGNMPDGNTDGNTFRPGHDFAAGIEGGGANDAYWTGGRVAYPLRRYPFNAFGITYVWPANKCYCFTPGDGFAESAV